ncbi:MAG: alanine--tRNA ligase [Candidatus Hodarchaeales archaeon]|jgi:alanyl-tRNA synthetase
MNPRELCKKYLEFFKLKKHAIIPSASLIPEQDPTVLFTTAGMHPLQPYLLGQPHPLGKRVANVQKCIRTSDIDEIGDMTHITFFEMLGNWSFGDYFKEKAISWSYEFLTDPKWLGIDPNRLSVTVFAGDDEFPSDEEAAEIWKKHGIPRERIYYLPREDNWWGPAGKTGPCGPCTEMFFDTGKDLCSPECKPGCSCGKYFEIWNDVFMTYNKNADSKYEPLEQHNVDTGMGVERTVAVLTGKSSVYEIEILVPLMKAIKKLANITDDPNEEQEKAMRIITDHIRAATFIMGDDRGIRPSNVEHGYVVRRLIRKSIRFGKQLNIQSQFLTQLANIVVDTYKDYYPELERNKDFILEGLTKEERNFSKALNRGLKRFNQILSRSGKILGEDAFLLFTSFGFPVEMTRELAEEQGFSINMEEFEEEFEHHRQLSRESTKRKFASGLADHSEKTTKLHTATHLLHQALRDVIGDHVQQKGSNVTEERTRFDYNFDRKLKAEEVTKIEDIVNRKVTQGVPVTKKEMSPDKARESGALGFFQEKYGEKVTVYSVGDYSKEICTGPHVTNTAEINGKIKIKKQKKIGAGSMRIWSIIEE